MQGDGHWNAAKASKNAKNNAWGAHLRMMDLNAGSCAQKMQKKPPAGLKMAFLPALMRCPQPAHDPREQTSWGQLTDTNQRSNWLANASSLPLAQLCFLLCAFASTKGLATLIRESPASVPCSTSTLIWVLLKCSYSSYSSSAWRAPLVSFVNLASSTVRSRQTVWVGRHRSNWSFGVSINLSVVADCEGAAAKQKPETDSSRDL